MKIYGSFTSPFVRHCRIVLLETGLTCEFIEVDATQSAQISPTKKVPLLVDGDILRDTRKRHSGDRMSVPRFIYVLTFCLIAGL